MGQVVQTFITDDQQAQKALLAIQQQMIRLREENKRLSQETKQASQGFAGFASKQLGDLKSMVLGYASVQGAIGLVSSAYSDWLNNIRKVAAENEKLMSGTLQAITGAGLLSQGPRVENFLASLMGGGSGITREQGLALFGGVTEEGRTLSIDRQEEIVKELRGITLLLAGDTGKMRTQAQLAGGLGEIFPNLSPNDIADLSQTLASSAGKDVDQLSSRKFMLGLQKLIDTGAVDESGAAGLALHALQRRVGPNVVGSISDAVAGEYEPRRQERGKPFGAEDAAYNAFASADPRKRLEMLLGNKSVRDVIMPGSAGQVAQLDLAGMEAAMSKASRDQQNDRLQADIALALGTEVGSMTAGDQGIDVRLDEERYKQRFIADAWDDANKEIEIAKTRRGTFGQMRVSTVAGLEHGFNMLESLFGGGGPGEYLKSVGQNLGDQELTNRGIEMITELKKISEQLEEQSRIMRGNTQSGGAARARSIHDE